MQDLKTIYVAAAVILQDDKILCVQRKESKFKYISKKWEFPGGKIEPNETSEETIKREIQEELNISISVRNHLLQVKHTYPDFRLIMETFLCKIENGEIQLNEHIDAKWLTLNELLDLDWAAADIPIVQKLIENNN
jgi:8-oxo-dGTP diphosphatase